MQSSSKLISDFLAESIGTNLVVACNLLRQLKQAGIFEISRGVGKISLKKPFSEISLLDIYNAVEGASEKRLFRIHENPNSSCLVDRNLKRALKNLLDQGQKAMETGLASIKLSSVKGRVRRLIKEAQDCFASQSLKTFFD